MIIPVQIRLSRTLIAIRWWCRKHCVDSEPWYNTECLLSTKGSALQHYIISPTPLCLCSIGAIVFHDCHLLSLALYGLSCYITTGTGKPITYLSPTRYRTQFGVLEIWKSRTLGKTSVKKSPHLPLCWWTRAHVSPAILLQPDTIKPIYHLYA